MSVLSACHGTTEDPINLGPKPEAAQAAPAAEVAPALSEEEQALAETCACAVTPVPDSGAGPAASSATTCPTECPSPPPSTSPTNPVPIDDRSAPLSSPLVDSRGGRGELGDPFRPFAGGDAACPGNTQLPAGCILLGGTTLEDARWLQCHRNRGNNCSEFCCWITGPVMSSCSLTQAQIDQIAADCATGTPAERMKCAGDKVKAALAGTGSVCRHHTRCMNFVLSAMGMPTDLETSTTHAWTEVPSSPNGTYIIDAYNNIYYWCP